MKEPVVWVPLLAVVIVLLKIKFPKVLINSFELLGKATGGVALFVSDIVLYSYKVSFNKLIDLAVVAKNESVGAFCHPGHCFPFGFQSFDNARSRIDFVNPHGAIVIMLAIQYKECEREISFILFLNTIISILTMGLFIWLLNT